MAYEEMSEFEKNRLSYSKGITEAIANSEARDALKAKQAELIDDDESSSEAKDSKDSKDSKGSKDSKNSKGSKGSKGSKQLQLQTFGFMQYVDHNYWDWGLKEKESHMVDKMSFMKQIYMRLVNGYTHTFTRNIDDEEEAMSVYNSLVDEIEFSIVLHDKDHDSLWDPDKGAYVIEPIEPHFHAVVKLPKKRDVSVIAHWLGLETQYIEAPTRGRYGKENMLAYLIHAKDPSKYQYNPKEVVTFDSFDYYDYWQRHYDDWEKQKAKVHTNKNKVSGHWLVKQVQLGKLTKRDIMKNDEYKSVYADNMVSINNAIEFRNEDMAFRTIEALENGEFNLTVYFFYGPPGSGKTTMAKRVASELERKNEWRSYEASGGNPMDNYTSEEIVILDDLRAANMTSTQWLQMMDHMSKATLDARYKNKGKAYRALFICAYQDPYTFFSYVKGTGGTSEALEQFIRRLLYHIKVIKTDTGERQVLIEQVVQDSVERAFLLHDEDWAKVEKGTPLLKNGVPLLETRPKHYDEGLLKLAASSGELKFTKYFGAPVFEGSVSEGVDLLTEVIQDRNKSENVSEFDDRMHLKEALDKGIILKDDSKKVTGAGKYGNPFTGEGLPK